MLNRRHFVTAATAVVALFPAVAQAQQVGTPVTVEQDVTTSGQGVSDSPAEMIRWMAFEGATIVTLPATREVLIRELTGAIDMGYFTHIERTYPRGDSLETIHSYRITPLGRAVGHKMNLGPDGDEFMSTVGQTLSTTEDATLAGPDALKPMSMITSSYASPQFQEYVMPFAAAGYVRPTRRVGAGQFEWTATPYAQMLEAADR